MQKLHDEGRINYPKEPDGSFDTSKRPALKRYLNEQKGSIITNIWLDINPLHSSDAERLGYPKQKPLELLERIVQASSNEGDIVLDPFCGCGTTIAAAQTLKRQWIGIDITHLSIALQKYRLKDMFGLKAGKDYYVLGEPQSLSGAAQLARDDRYQFQWWALSLVKARPVGGSGKIGKKGADKGIDGVIYFIDEKSGQAKKALIQVKSGHVTSGHIRDLRGVIERDDAAMGVYITLEKPTKDMQTEAISSGYYHSKGWAKDYPRLQIVTIEELLNGKEINMPPASITFKQASKSKEEKNSGQQNIF
jgi:site-specific DNA-methyltransferase (adenine-specific)